MSARDAELEMSGLLRGLSAYGRGFPRSIVYVQMASQWGRNERLLWINCFHSKYNIRVIHLYSVYAYRNHNAGYVIILTVGSLKSCYCLESLKAGRMSILM